MKNSRIHLTASAIEKREFILSKPVPKTRKTACRKCGEDRNTTGMIS